MPTIDKLLWSFIVIILVFLIWFLWAAFTYNLPCDMIKGDFVVNGTEYLKYAQRCGW